MQGKTLIPYAVHETQGGHMPFKDSTATLLMVVCAGALVALEAEQAGRGGGRGGAAAGIFTAADLNKDGSLTRDELKTTFAKWLSDGDSARTGSLTQDQLAAAVNAALPQPAMPSGGGRGAAPQNQTPKPEEAEKMIAAVPAKA